MGGILLGIAVICLGAPAIRLLSAAVRTRREAELWLGLALGLAALGLPLRFLSGIAVAQSADQGLDVGASMALLSATSHGLTALGSIFIYVFVWRVFHPSEPRARYAVAIVCTGIVLSFGWLLASGGYSVERHPSVLFGNLLRGAAFPWCCVESLRYWRMMKRRVALGIGDPVVANRFALWAIWTGTFALLPGLVLLTKLIASQSGDSAGTLEMMLPALRLTMLVTVIVSFVCIGLSFFPPARYRDRLRAGARDQAATS